MKEIPKHIPIYSTVCDLEFQAIHGSIRKHIRDSIHHETRYDIDDKLDWIVSDTIFVSVSNNVNGTLQDYEFKK
jgi:hypothetical protein